MTTKRVTIGTRVKVFHPITLAISGATVTEVFTGVWGQAIVTVRQDDGTVRNLDFARDPVQIER